MSIGLDPDCHYGDHTWAGTSACERCGKRLRCYCGQFVREDGIDAHLARCPFVLAAAPDGQKPPEAAFDPEGSTEEQR